MLAVGTGKYYAVIIMNLSLVNHQRSVCANPDHSRVAKKAPSAEDIEQIMNIFGTAATGDGGLRLCDGC